MSAVVCDFDVAARVLDLDGTTELVDLSDAANGFVMLNPIGWPRNMPQRPRTDWGRAWGDIPHGVPTLGVGQLTLNARTEGTWTEAMARQETIRAALYGAVFDYFVELDAHGTRYRWLTDWPSMEPADVRSAEEIDRGWWPYRLTFIVQPRPTITAVP